MKAWHLFIFPLLTLLTCYSPTLLRAQTPARNVSGDSYMNSAEVSKLKSDSINSCAYIRKGIAAYLKQGQIREAAEAWLILENYYAFFHGPGYGPRIAYYEQALKLFNRAHITARASDTRRILGFFLLQSAQEFRAKNDSARCNAELRRAIAVYAQNGQIREEAEAWLTMENNYAYFQGRGYGPRIAYYKKALVLFNRAHLNDRAAATLTILGDFYQEQGRNKEALAVLNRSLAMYRTSDKIDLRRLYAVLGNVNTKLGDYSKALEYKLLGVKAAEIAGDTTLMFSSLLNGVGATYMNTRNYKQALNYFNKALQAARKKQDLNFIVLFSRNAAIALNALKKSAEGYELLLETERIYHPKDVINRLTFHLTCLNILTDAKRYGAAKKYSDTLLRLEPQVDEADFHRAAIWQGQAAYYTVIKNYAEAQEYVTKFERWSTSKKDNLALINALALQYKLDSVKGDYMNEIKSYRRFINMRDKMYSQIKNWQIAQVDIAYQTEKKDQQIKAKEININMLKKQAQLQAINIRQKENTQKLIIAGIVLLALLLGLSYNRYRLKQRVNHQLQQQQAEISQKNLSLTNLIAEKDNLIDEKEWLMKEIHHRVKNNLQVVISLLNTQSSFLNDEVAYNAIRESQHRMQSISLIHQKLYQSDNLALVNMPAYISDLVQYLSGSFDLAGRIKFEIAIAPIELDVTKSVPLGLILNEAITNSIKYAFPEGRDGKIAIRLSDLGESNYELMIQDNGVGLAENDDLSKSKTLGMSLMRGLSKQLSGKFSVKSDDGIKITLAFADEKRLQPLKIE
jgi:two-component sensor histidine kinase